MTALARESVIGVIGAGVMGAGIAQVAAAAGHTVLLLDAQPEAIARARAGIDKDLFAFRGGMPGFGPPRVGFGPPP